MYIRVLKLCLYLFGSPNSLITFYTKTALLFDFRHLFFFIFEQSFIKLSNIKFHINPNIRKPHWHVRQRVRRMDHFSPRGPFYGYWMSPATIQISFAFLYGVFFFFTNFKTNLGFLNRFSQKSPISNFTEILRVEAAIMHAYRRTDMTQVICGFRRYAHAPRNRGWYPVAKVASRIYWHLIIHFKYLQRRTHTDISVTL